MLNGEIDKKQICGTDQPLKELAWLKKEIYELETSGYTQYFWVKQAELKGETVFIFGNCNPLWNSVLPVLNCRGEEVCYYMYNCSELGEIENEKLIWKGQVSECYQ